MDRRHARYPFLEGAREAVEAAAVDLADLVTGEDRAVLERARERVEAALREGTTGEPSRRTRVELLSYPVARVIVSLVEEPALVRTYARAEAAVAHERFREDFAGEDLRSTEEGRLTLDAVLREFDLDGAVTPREDGFDVAVAPYLRLSAGFEDPEWRLATRRLHDGTLPIDREELLALLEGAVEDRVAEDLPLAVPDAVAEPLAPTVDAVREAVADLDVSRSIETVVPALFPPCVEALLERCRDGERLPAHSRFALVSFLASLGLSADEALERFDLRAGVGEERLREQFAVVADDRGGAAYPPPTCTTMQEYGDCVNKDDVCAEIAHPLSYYERRLERADQ